MEMEDVGELVVGSVKVGEKKGKEGEVKWVH